MAGLRLSVSFDSTCRMSRGRFIITFIKGKGRRGKDGEAREERKQDSCNVGEELERAETSTSSRAIIFSGSGGLF